MKTHILLLCCSLTAGHLSWAQNIDPNYPEIDQFVKAGRRGGIPNVVNIKARVNPGDNLQNSIDRGGAGVILLSPGTYRITRTLELADGVVLRGTRKDSVKISADMRGGTAIEFPRNTENAGLENLRVVYEALPNPPKQPRSGLKDGRFCRECFQNDFPDYDTNLVKIEGSNNWLSNIEVINSGSDPIQVRGNHNTIRDTLVDNCYNKGGGGEGYFEVRGDSNLITTTTVRRIRHFSIQLGAKYNVIYKNRIEGDVNYHNGDDGHNLVEQNEIIRPSWHTWGVFATGGARFGHRPPGPRNIIFNNTTFDHRENRTEYSTPGVVYTYRSYGDPSETNWPQPKGGTFYPVGNSGGGNSGGGNSGGGNSGGGNSGSGNSGSGSGSGGNSGNGGGSGSGGEAIDVGPLVVQDRYLYDFGTPTSPLENGYSRVSELNTAGYYRWNSSASGISSINRNSGGGTPNIYRDFNTATVSKTFVHQVVNGTWQIRLSFFDANSSHNDILVRAEGRNIATNIDLTPGQLVERFATVEVTDGTLNIEFRPSGGDFIINRIILTRQDTNNGELTVGTKIVLRGNNGRYVSGTNPMTCNSRSIGAVQEFTVVDGGGGLFVFRASNGRYVSSENGRTAMNANRTAIGRWERFTVTNLGDNQILIKGNNGRYVSSENGRGAMNCNRSAARGWERFTWEAR